MATPFPHPNNRSYWYGNVGKGKKRRIVNLKVPLTDPIETAQAKLDALNAEWDAKQDAPAKPKPTPALKTLTALFAEYRALKDLHYRKSRRGFKNAADRVKRILDFCAFVYPSDIDGVKVLAYIDGRRGPKFGASTAEHYRKDFMWFCNWLIEKGHLTRRPFGRRDKFKGELHHRRRVLSPADKRKLLTAAGASSAKVYRLPGPVRRLVYWTALVTGYRSGELQALTVACLQGDRLKLAGEHTKNGDDADQPLTRSLADALREHTKGKAPEALLFGKWERGAKMLRADLKAAGIPYATPDGTCDMHALRHTFCTDLFAAGVDAKTAHVLMRHKSIEMTMSYAKTDDARKAEAISRLDGRAELDLPADLTAGEVRVGPKDGRVERLFGTDDLEALELLGKVTITEAGGVELAFGPFAGEVLGDVSEPPEDLNESAPFNQTVIKGAVAVSPCPVSAPCRTRTYNPLIKSQLLCQLS